MGPTLKDAAGGARLPLSSVPQLRMTQIRTRFGLTQLTPETCMKLATHVKSISYLKAHAAEILRELGEVQEPYVITQNGEAKAVIQDIVSYERTQEALAFMKIMALGDRQIAEGKTAPMEEVFRRIRARHKARR